MTSVGSQALWLWMFVVLPLWLVAGFLDWCCHRHTAIERTAGARESTFHVVMFLQMGSAALMGLLLEPTPAMLMGIAVLVLVHEATTWLELRFVVERRHVAPFEQVVHSFMEILPVAGLLLLSLVPAAPGESGFRLRQEPLPAPYLATVAVAVLVFNMGPLLEEHWRCLRHARAVAAGTGARG